MFFLIVLFSGILIGYFFGCMAGYSDADKMTQYWFESSMDYMRKWLDTFKDEPDDDGGIQIRVKQQPAEPPKAMAAGVGRRG